MRKHFKIIVTSFLFALFSLYQVSCMLFVHAHFIDGVAFVHSHPFGEESHTHTQAEVLFIDRLQTFQGTEPDLIVWKPVFYCGGFADLPVYYSLSFYQEHLLSSSLKAPPFLI